MMTEAMIFAAGLGTRMAPLTDHMPKALVPVKSRPLLGHVMDRLVAAGAKRLVVNTSVHGDQITAWLKANTPAGVEIVLSPEPDGPYDTGGGLKAAAHLFTGDGPILVHNVDILSRIPLEKLLAGHKAARSQLGDRLVATMATQTRETKRRVQFDEGGLMGWGDLRAREARGRVRELAFAGIHVIEPALLGLITMTGTFPIRDVYLDLAAQGRIIRSADVSESEWFDVGTPERLRDAEARWS